MSQTLPRLAIFAKALGIPSEIWIRRQALGFTGFDPILAGWELDKDAGGLSGLPHELVGGGFPEPAGPVARALRRIGSAGAYRLHPAQKRAIAETVARIRPQIVLSHFGWTGIRLAQALPPDLPMVLHVHGRDASALMEQPAYRAALAQVMKRASALVAVGNHQVERLRPLGLPARVEVIPCGAPLALFAQRPLPEQAPASPRNPVRFISVGRMSEEKGMRHSLHAFERVLAECPDVELVLIGYGPLLDPLREEVAAKGLGGKVRLTGRLSPDEIAAELAGAHVYLQHSRKVGGWVEGCVVTLTEGGASGLPMVGSASGGIPDQIFPGDNGFLFDEGDVAAQAAHMLALARDPDLRARMGARARETASRIDSALMTTRLETLLKEVLAAGVRAGRKA